MAKYAPNMPKSGQISVNISYLVCGVGLALLGPDVVGDGVDLADDGIDRLVDLGEGAGVADLDDVRAPRAVGAVRPLRLDADHRIVDLPARDALLVRAAGDGHEARGFVAGRALLRDGAAVEGAVAVQPRL